MSKALEIAKKFLIDLNKGREGRYLEIDEVFAEIEAAEKEAAHLQTVTFDASQWKLVPIEPTEDMIIAGFESVPDRGFDRDDYPEEYDDMSGCQQAAFRAKRCYAAMLNVAPQPKAKLMAPQWLNVKNNPPHNLQNTVFKNPRSATGFSVGYRMDSIWYTDSGYAAPTPTEYFPLPDAAPQPQGEQDD